MKKTTLKIAMVTSWEVRCGIFTYTQNLSNALANENCEVFIIRIPRFGRKNNEVMVNLARKIPVDEIDIVHLQHEYGIWQELEQPFFTELKVLTDKPIITTMHSIGNWKQDPIIHHNSTCLITHNKFCSERLGYKNIIIPHGAKPTYDMPTSEEAKSGLGIPKEAPIIGYCGYISEYKGVDILVEAMKKIPEAALLIGGGWFREEQNTYIANLRQTALKTLTGRCRFLGYVSTDDLPRVYAAMDIVVYPSRFATESGALIMALSHGKPVISSNLAPFREKEQEKALITFKSIADLRKKIKHLLRNKNKLDEMSRNAYRYAEKTSWTNTAKQHLQLYKQKLEEKQNG